MHGDEFAGRADTGTATISERYGRCRRRRGGVQVAQGVLGRAVSGVNGAWRTTRAAADAAVRRAKRFFFRDEG